MIVEGGKGHSTQPQTHNMKAKRKSHQAEFKARVALEALKGIKTVQQIAKEFEVHPAQVSDWKKPMAEQAASVCGRGARSQQAEEFERERNRLHAKIGQQAVELEWLTKKSQQLGLSGRGSSCWTKSLPK